MNKEDLAKEYAYTLYGERTDEKFNQSAEIFDAYDIEDAFNAGRNSVIDNIPDLEWSIENGRPTASNTIFDYSYTIKNKIGYYYAYGLGSYIGKYNSLDEVKRAAEEDYKNRIKQALGL